MSAYYCYFEGVKGVDAIYLVSADNLPWATIKAEDVITSLMTSNYLVDLKNVEVVYNGKKTVYEVESSGASTDTDSDGKTTALAPIAIELIIITAAPIAAILLTIFFILNVFS